MVGSPTSPDSGQPPRPPHNSSPSPDNSDIFASSPPLPTIGDDSEDFHYFGDGFSDVGKQSSDGEEQSSDGEEQSSDGEEQSSDGEEQSSNAERPDLPETPVRGLPRQNTPMQLPGFGRTFAHTSPDDPTFSQIDQLTTSRLRQDAMTQLINGAHVQQSRGVADDLLDSTVPPVNPVISQEIRQQGAGINAPSTQASQRPNPAQTYVFDNGYEERPEPDEMQSGTSGYAPARGDPFAGPKLSGFDSRRNMFAELVRGTNYDPSINPAPVNQQPVEGYMPAQGDRDDDEESPQREDEKSSERVDTPTVNPARLKYTTLNRIAVNRTAVNRPIVRRIRCAGVHAPRTRGNRVRPRRSDPHPHFSSTDPQAIQDAEWTHTIARGTRESGRNLMALFDGSETPRTRYRLRIQSGRTGQHARTRYHEANDEIPARLSLREICQNYPNHVWGTGLRLFMHEYVSAEQIYNYLPDDVRMKGCRGRLHNYLQQAMGRQTDEMMEEDTGEVREPMRRTRNDDDDDDDEEEERKPKKQKTATTPGGRQKLAPAPTPSQQPFSQRSPTSPFVVQTQGGGAAPPGEFQRLPTTNTPLPAAGIARGQPSPPPSPPRTTHDLYRLITTELAIHRDHAIELVRAHRGEVAAAEAQRIHHIRSYSSDRNMINRLLQHYQLAVNPVPDGSVVGLMLWILNHGMGGPVGQAEVLAAQDINSVALNWYLAMLRELTQQYRDLVEAGRHAQA